jgi:hypothetical protein
MDITASFRLTEREFRSAMRHLPTTRRLTVVGVLMVLLDLVLLTGSHPDTWFLFLGPGILLFLEFGVVRAATRKSAPLFAQPWTVVITDRTYSLHTPASRAEVLWSLYQDVTERHGFWYLRQQNRAVGFLPLRVFDDADRARLAAFFAAHLPPRKRPWYRPF